MMLTVETVRRLLAQADDSATERDCLDVLLWLEHDIVNHEAHAAHARLVERVKRNNA